MPLDPQAEALLAQLALEAVPPEQTSVAVRRAEMYKMLAHAGPAQPVASIQHRAAHGPNGSIPLRLYTPEGPGPFPVLAFFHGGGWVLGDLETHDPLCRLIANRAGCLVASVEYRLAPEHRFPAAPEDCYAATQWLAAHAADFQGDPAAIAVGGDSAGGNLAAVTALMAHDRGGPALRYQWLLYPVTAYYDPPTPSYLDNAEGYGVTRESMIWFWNQYLPDEASRIHPYAAILAAPDLAGVPPALVVTAEYDVLRDEAEAYAGRLRQAGVPAKVQRVDGQIHGFANRIAVLDRGRQALVEAVDVLKAALAGDQAI